MINQADVKKAVKDYVKSKGVTGIRFVKVTLNRGSGTSVHISLYLDKPIELTFFNGLIDELSKRYGLRNWLIYAPHGRLIRLSATST
jgi:hypothetical protein